MDKPLPASQTKHLTNLSHPLPPPHSNISVNLRQISSSSGGGGTGTTGTTGTTLWLSAQILSLYLSSTLGTSTTTNNKNNCNGVRINRDDDEGKKKQKVVLELGSGIGYTPLVLANLGWKVLASDIEPVLSEVLKPNIEYNKRIVGNGIGEIEVRELDWIYIDKIQNDNQNNDMKDTIIPDDVKYLKEEGIDMIIMSDTFYSLSLIRPLWNTLLYISQVKDDDNKPPVIYISLERRDSLLIDHALETGKKMGFDLKKVNKSRLIKEIQSSGWGWEGEDWDGVEIWKCRWKG
ncbi:hypothetical protein V865_005876 [Kwoniella europaea PYCC6329]|uniref:Uncharacterized protein n=1 Tax=Kwoniella europaea PYCC6329 TaxID=1423913 RepID=A0AAX4KMZ6_9TREE